MKLIVLTDNNTYIDRYYLGEPAVSYFIEADGLKLLFDAGYSDVYRRNAAAMGIDLSSLDAVVLSHGHNDHSGGLALFPPLPAARRPRLVAHPGVSEEKLFDGLAVGIPLSRAELEARFVPSFSRKPVFLTQHLAFLGEIPRTNDFENQSPVGERFFDNTWQPDYLADDSALAWRGENGLCIITGCSHAGVCNIIAYARQVMGEKRIQAVIGGFHLFDDASRQMAGTLDYFAQLGTTVELYPCHCTSFAARAALHRQTPVREVGVGLTLSW